MKSPSLNFPSALRKISDTRLNGIHYSHTSKDDFQSGLLFPKLVFSKGTKNVNRVVNLNTACERKYRSWSDPSGEHILGIKMNAAIQYSQYRFVMIDIRTATIFLYKA